MLSVTMQRGDTLIEVLLAITIFSMVSVGTMTIMNQGTNASQRALEITQVRQQIDAQAEALRAAQQAFTISTDPANTTWNSIISPTDTTTYEVVDRCPSTPADVNDSFIMDGRTAEKVSGVNWLQSINASDALPHAQVMYDGGTVTSYGMWIERKITNGSANTPDAYNFNVRACWYGAGLDVPLQLETLVRLYDPS